MSAITQEEQLRRHRILESVLGTHAMEGIFPDVPTLAIMRRYESGELTLDQYSAAMDAHALELVAAARPLAGIA